MNYEALYSSRFQNINQKSREIIWNEISSFFATQSNNPMRVLDPACGKGEFINSCPAQEKWAIDITIDPENLHEDVKAISGSFLVRIFQNVILT